MLPRVSGALFRVACIVERYLERSTFAASVLFPNFVPISTWSRSQILGGHRSGTIKASVAGCMC